MQITIAHLINTLGLSANATGAVVALVFAYPQPAKEEPVAPGLGPDVLLNDGRTVAEHDAERKRTRRRFMTLFRIGFGLMSFGFTLQLIAMWIAN